MSLMPAGSGITPAFATSRSSLPNSSITNFASASTSDLMAMSPAQNLTRSLSENSFIKSSLFAETPLSTTVAPWSYRR